MEQQQSVNAAGNGILVPTEGGGYRGNITTLDFVLKIELRPNLNYPREQSSPKWHVFAVGRHGQAVQCGSAWVKKSGPHSARPGEEFISLLVDDPSMDQPLNVTAFPRDGGSFEIVWRRARRRPDPASFRPDSGRAVDDEIPY